MYIVRYGGQDHSRSWKLVPIECICDFLLVPHCNYAYFLSFPSYNDLLVENLRFCLKLSQADSPRTCVKIAIKKLCYSPGGEKPYNLTVIRLESIPACDRRTDGQMDGWRRRLVSQHTLYIAHQTSATQIEYQFGLPITTQELNDGKFVW